VTVWNHSISWSKAELALKCQKALQYACEKTKTPGQPVTYWADLGKLVQKTYEMYFNQQLNLNPAARNVDVLERAARKVLASPFRASLETVYAFGKTPETLEAETIEQVRNGYPMLEELGILTKPVRSEVMVNSVFQGFRMFGALDFLYVEKGFSHVIDGKGHQKENADPNQVRYYALSLMASGRKVGRSGLLYWRHGFREVDVSPAAMRVFIDEVINPIRPIFIKLKQGTEHFPANPSEANCKFCNWRTMCPDSVAYRTPVTDVTPGNVGL